MLVTCSLKFLIGKPLFRGSAIINLVIMCSMTILFSLTRSRMAKYLMLICLLRLPHLSFLAKKTAAELSQCNLNDLSMESMTLRP